MANNKFMGTFNSESEVLEKIEELKATGSREEDMFVMARDEDQISMVRGRTDVDYKSSEGNWMDKFMGFLSGDDSTREAFSGLGLDKEEADRYYDEVHNGKILLFVDREFGASYEGKAPYDNQAYGRTGSTTDSDVTDPRSPGYAESGTVARDGLTVDTNEENDANYNRRDGALGEGESMDQSLAGNETAGVGHDSGTGFGLGSPDTADRDYDRRDKDDYNDSTLGRDHTQEEKLRLHEERTVDAPVEREEADIDEDTNLTDDTTNRDKRDRF